MNLREIHDELVRRGMPPHPVLGDERAWIDDDGSMRVGEPYEYDHYDAQSVHDMLTMHALRWAMGRPDIEGPTPMRGDGELWWCANHTHYSDPLEAILVLTENVNAR